MTQGGDKHCNNTPAMTALTHPQIIIQEWEENRSHFNIKLWGGKENAYNLQNGDAHKSM